MAAGTRYAGLSFFGPCLHRFRREFRKTHRDALDRGDVVDVDAEDVYLLGLTGASRPKHMKDAPHTVLHFSKVVKALTFRTAYDTLGPALDAMCGPDTVKNPLMVEPCGDGGRSYRHRGDGHVFDPYKKHWVTAISSLAAHSLREDVPRDYVLDLPALAKKEYAAVPDAANSDCVFLLKAYHFAAPASKTL